MINPSEIRSCTRHPGRSPATERAALANDQSIYDERAVAVIANQTDAFARSRRRADRQDSRAAFEIDGLRHAIGASHAYAIGMEIDDFTDDDVRIVKCGGIPFLLPLRVIGDARIDEGLRSDTRGAERHAQSQGNADTQRAMYDVHIP